MAKCTYLKCYSKSYFHKSPSSFSSPKKSDKTPHDNYILRQAVSLTACYKVEIIFHTAL